MSVALPVGNRRIHELATHYGAQLRITGLSKSYRVGKRAVQALDGIDLAVSEGEFVSIVGPSGCGKSTLFNIVAGLDQPDEGTITIDGAPVNGPGPDRVVVFQSGALFPWLTVRQNVEFGLRVRNVPALERRRRAEEMLAMMHLGRFADQRIHQLSGGMRQRVAIARALVLRPKLLLMDEPFAALDAQTRNVLHKELQDLRQHAKMTVLFVTHNVEEATKLGDRVIVLSYRPGRVLLDVPITCSHPRAAHDPRLQRPIHRILSVLTHEVERAAEEEMEGRA